MEAVASALHTVTGLLPLPAAVAGATATATGLGVGLFNYNRVAYTMDTKLQYLRFEAGTNLASAQTKMYREDVQDLSDLTSNRMTTIHTVATMALTCTTALLAPGRVGLQTPAPPQWVMGLFMINLAGCYLFLVLTMWLAMHASIRADTAATHILTRFVRLPIPSTKMMDKMRKFLASYEQRPLREVLRFPLMKHKYHSVEKKADGGYNEGQAIEIDPDVAARSRHGYDVPAWYREEKAKGEKKLVWTESMLPPDIISSEGQVPEHFEVYREIQNEWWPYDVYARVCMFLAHMHLFHAWTYQQIGHHFAETRGLFAAASVVIPLMVLQQILMVLDVNLRSGHFPIEKIGPFAQVFAYIAVILEYRRLYDAKVQMLGFVLVYLALMTHAVYTVGLLRICRPTMATASDGEAESRWWPGHWTLPGAFSHAVWLVAPPDRLEKGQNDLIGETRNRGQRSDPGFESQSKVLDPDQRKDVHTTVGKDGETPAWTNVKLGLYAMLIAWSWMTLAFTVDVATQGTTTPSFLNAPGLPNNARDPRWRRPQFWHTKPTTVGTGGREAGPFISKHAKHQWAKWENYELHGAEYDLHGRPSTMGSDTTNTQGNVVPSSRRLLSAVERGDIVEQLQSLIPRLKGLGIGEDATQPAKVVHVEDIETPPPVAILPQQIRVQWPPLFEPRLLACAGAFAANKSALILSRNGRGLVVQLTHPARSTSLDTTIESFTLESAGGFGPLLSVSYDAASILLATSSGAVLECPSEGRSRGRWRCAELAGAMLPFGPEEHFTGVATVARSANDSASLRAVVAFPGEVNLVFFTRRIGAPNAPWIPTGEGRIPRPYVSAKSSVVGLAFESSSDTLLVSFSDGTASILDTTTGLPRGLELKVASGTSTASSSGRVWQGACGLPDGDLFHLLLEPTPPSRWKPKLLIGSTHA